ncbi:epimerase [Enterovibrio norvegicus]|uniref:GDP-mannose 4,6-dehydratase n=1 Tax=Enterovibrio norvegicus TaxID=188144 RepID=UPI0002F24B4C|nr:GDP-mannose 4,6-dehydratase [Enterovibrio norvegicus]OEF59633.1 epimerase [Enterovibrio norvegicus]
MKTVLVTGLSGFTGKHVETELKDSGYNVVGLSSECDITDKQSVKLEIERLSPEYVIHLAALSFVQHSDQKALYDVNVFGTLNILEAINELVIPIKKLVIASSANIYGNPENAINIGEQQSPSPVNHYAMSKLAMEYMVRTWFDRLPIVITRPFNYTGIGQAEHFIVPKIVKHFRDGKKIIQLGNTDVSRDFSDVTDVAKVYVKLMESGAVSETVNICSGSLYSLESIIKAMEDIAGYSISVEVNPEFVRTNEIKALNGDNTKLQSLIGFTPSKPLKETLKEIFLNNESSN